MLSLCAYYQNLIDMEHSKDDLPNAILGHILEVQALFFIAVPVYLKMPNV